MNTHDQSWAQIKSLSKQRVIVINVDKAIDILIRVACVLALIAVYAVIDLHDRQVDMEISSAGPDIFCPTNIAGLSIRCNQGDTK